MMFLWPLLFLSLALHADVLFIDLNNSRGEVNACEQGAGRGRVHTVSREGVDNRTVEAKIAQLERQGVTVDSIVISGHDGSGVFFGTNGEILSNEIDQILKRHPHTRNSITTMALWGCYTSTASACLEYWGKAIAPQTKTVGWTLQSPLGTDPASWDSIGQFCRMRHQVASAQSKSELNSLVSSIGQKLGRGVGICTEKGICAADYRGVVECYQSYDQLIERCRYDSPSESDMQTYYDYLNARKPGFQSPPADNGESITTEGFENKNAGALRRFYNKVHLWWHCSQGSKVSAAKVDLPEPPTVLRLVRFETFKRSFERNNKEFLAEYNSLMRGLGLANYELRPATQSRAEMNLRIKTVQNIVNSHYKNRQDVKGDGPKDATWRALMQRAGESEDYVDIGWLKKMVDGLDRSLRTVDWHCTNASYVEDDSFGPGKCVAGYGKRSQR